MATAEGDKGTLVWDATRMHDARAHFGLNLCESCRDMFGDIWITSRGMRCDQCTYELVTEAIPGLKARHAGAIYSVVQEHDMEALLGYADAIQLWRKPDGEETLEITHLTDKVRSRLSRYED